MPERFVSLVCVAQPLMAPFTQNSPSVVLFNATTSLRLRGSAAVPALSTVVAVRFRLLEREPLLMVRMALAAPAVLP